MKNLLRYGPKTRGEEERSALYCRSWSLTNKNREAAIRLLWFATWSWHHELAARGGKPMKLKKNQIVKMVRSAIPGLNCEPMVCSGMWLEIVDIKRDRILVKRDDPRFGAMYWLYREDVEPIS